MITDNAPGRVASTYNGLETHRMSCLADERLGSQCSGPIYRQTINDSVRVWELSAKDFMIALERQVSDKIWTNISWLMTVEANASF